MVIPRGVKSRSTLLWVIVLAGLGYLLLANSVVSVAAPLALPDTRAERTITDQSVLQVPVTPTLALLTPSDPQPVTATIDVAIVVSGAIDLAAFELDIEYDRSQLDVTGMTLSTLLGDPALTCDPVITRCVAALGPIDQLNGTRVGAYSFGSGSGFTGTGTLAAVHFQPTGLPGVVPLNVANALWSPHSSPDSPSTSVVFR